MSLPTSDQHHSFIRRLPSIIMRHYYSLLVAILAGFTWSFPSQMNVPFIVRQEIDKLSIGTEQTKNENTIDYGVSSNKMEDEMTTIEMIKKIGYPAEEHFIKTEDGYILALHRIPGSKGSPPVLLHHALMESSFSWVINGKGKSLAFILADNGYDVWMANVRGNTYSRNHTTISPSESKFWNFSWHEIAMYDVPAEIEYITLMTNDTLLYIGHSMGTTIFFAMASELPNVASKIKAMIGLAPVTSTKNIRGLFRYLGSLLMFYQTITDSNGHGEFFAQNTYFKFAARYICNRPILRDICRSIIFTNVGFNSEGFNVSMLPIMLTHTPAGTSIKTLMHFSQGTQSERFQQYDYGKELNKKIYHSEKPPEYNLKRIPVPVALFWSQNDYLADEIDVKRLYKNLPDRIGMYEVNDRNFNHLDFIWGIRAPEILYPRVLSILDKYRNSS